MRHVNKDQPIGLHLLAQAMDLASSRDVQFWAIPCSELLSWRYMRDCAVEQARRRCVACSSPSQTHFCVSDYPHEARSNRGPELDQVGQQCRPAVT
jgi:hypothetical protein